MEIIHKITPTNNNIAEAICLRTAECFGAMNLANAFSGVETDSWYLVRNYPLAQLKEEALGRGLVFTGEYDVLKGEIWR